MRRFGIFHALWMSFFSKPLYRDVAFRWSGLLGIVYLLLLMAVSWIPDVVQLHVSMRRDFDRSAGAFLDQIPEITIRDGRASVRPEGPLAIVNPESGEELVLIDMLGTLDYLKGKEAAVMITETELLVKNANRGEIRILPLENFEPYIDRVDREVVARWLDIFQSWFAPLFYVVAVPSSFIYRLLQALLYAAIAMIFVKIAGAPLGYAAALRLAEL